MLLSGFLATIWVGYTKLPPIIALPLVVIIGIVVGGILGALVGWLKYQFNIHEVVSTIMFNYILEYIVGFFINTYYADRITRSSKFIEPTARLTLTGVTVGGLNLNIPLGFIVALAAVFIIHFVLDKTTLGFELKAVGFNRSAARYAGISEGRSIVLAMTISGILAGVAGVCYYLGYYNTIVPKQLANLGYDAIGTALVGNLSPYGAIFASALVTVFQKGAVYMSSQVSTPSEIASVITGILLFFAACNVFMRYFAHSRLEKERRRIEKLEEKA
jgi:simple sugar transport system permease protein